MHVKRLVRNKPKRLMNLSTVYTMSTTYKTIINDMKTSLKLAWGRALSYFLANLGMLIVVAILGLLIAIPVAAFAFVAFPPFSFASMNALAEWASDNLLISGTFFVLVGIFVVSLLMVVSGSIYGMSHDLVTKGDTRAETAFSYLRRKFLTFMSTGAMLAIIVLLAPVVAWGLASYNPPSGFHFNIISAPMAVLLTVFTFVWIFITGGLTSMVFPAVVSGKGVQAAFKESFSLASRYFDRIFGLLSAIVLLLAATFGPVVLLGIVAPALFAPPMIPPMMMTFIPALAAVGIWTVVSVFLWLLLFLPMVRIAWVRVYQELTGGTIATQSVVNVPIV